MAKATEAEKRLTMIVVVIICIAAFFIIVILIKKLFFKVKIAIEVDKGIRKSETMIDYHLQNNIIGQD